MNVKRIIGSILTVLGAAGLVYASILFVNLSGNVHNIKEIVIFAALGLIFFISGIGLIQTTRDN